MKISLIIPPSGQYTDNKNWLWWVYKELIKLGNEVLLNVCTKDCDVIICMAISQIKPFLKYHNKFPDIPIITYNWDWFSFIDTTKGDWPRFTELMKKSIDIWTPTNYMVKRMNRILGLKHHVIEACSVLEECMGKPVDNGYVIQASRRDKRYKNFDFFERGCTELGIQYISCHPSKYDRETYISILRKCKILVDACTEDSNTSLSTIEAAFFKKPMLVSDIEVHREGWGEKQVVLFKNNDFNDFKLKLKGLYNGDIKVDVEGAFNSAIKRYTPNVMANSIDKRLKEIL